MELPPVTLLRQLDTHRLIPSVHSRSGDSVLADIADDDEHLKAIFEIDAATNDRLRAEQGRVPTIGPRISVDELVAALPFSAVINAAFCHPHPLGARFSSPRRGAWYAAFDLATAKAEVGFHKSVQLAEINRFEDTVTYDDYLADFSARFHDVRRVRGRQAWLSPDSYVESQGLAESLLDAGSLGVVYPSVRHEGGTCISCFRPALVANVRRSRTWRFTWSGSPTPTITRVGKLS
jgi:hypothetical protein